MKKEEACRIIDNLDYYLQHYTSPDYGERDHEAMMMAKKALEPEPRWIPVSERLPENKETVLVTFKHFVSGNIIGLGSVVVLRGKPHWHVREQNLGTYDVIAWMPLPKPYSEVGE